LKNKLTVITPTYNRAHTLERVYNSLREQTFKDFIWIIMDDGSTDNTPELVDTFIREKILKIEYFRDRNRHKFITVFEGIKKVQTPYFVIIDSDDSWPEDSFQILYDAVSGIENKDEFIGVIGHSADTEGNLVGDLFPGEGFTGSIFEMRYKYKVRGDKNGIFITKSYLRELEKFDYSPYENKGYIPQNVFFTTYDAKGLKTKFINKIIRIYHKDENDAASVSNTRWTGKNIFGLREGHKSMLNNYGNRLFLYPKPLVRNLVGFQYYSFMNKVSLSSFFTEMKNPFIKYLSVFVLPFSYIYYLIKKQ
jgi:glycosyltransferase involved in cell wall biosynthesis